MTQATLQNIEIHTVGRSTMRYVGWPTVARLRDGRLVLVASAGRTRHVCPFGQVQWLESRDDGQSWTWPRVLVDTAMDDRDPGIVQTPQGALLMTWFTSLAWERRLHDAHECLQQMDVDERDEWVRRHHMLTDAIRDQELGCWAIRSTDGGLNWSPRIQTGVHSPHGPCNLQDGRMLFVGRRQSLGARDESGSPFGAEIGASISNDDGLTWNWIGNIPVMDGHCANDYHEAHAVQAADGRIIAHLRNHNEPHRHEILQTESCDGRTWSVPRSLGVVGFPCHLLVLPDGRLLSTFSYREAPKGNRVIVSCDQGRTWSEPLTINDDSTGDMGYPSTAFLGDSCFLTIWYESRPHEPTTTLRQARWFLP